VNTAAAETLGFRPEDGIGWNLRRFLSPAVEGEFDAYLDGSAPEWTAAHAARRKDGTERIWLYRNVLYEEPGQLPRGAGHARDVTVGYARRKRSGK
jgi:PAS domain S-box-containing protein